MIRIRNVLGLTMMVGCVSLFAFACGDDDKADPYPSTDAFCTDKAKLECGSNSVATCGVTSDGCNAARKAACLAAGSTATGQGRTYTSSKVEACLNATTTAYQKPTDKPSLDAYTDACQRVFSGAKTKGQPCANEYDCSGSLVCDLQKTTPLCADKTAKAENDGCANSGDICNAGLFCDLSGPAPLCHKEGAIGAACGDKAPCADGSFCNGATCVALIQTGFSCGADTDCASTFCNKAIGKCAGRQFPSETSSCADFGG